MIKNTENMDLKGICPIIAQPFTKSGEVDEASMKNLVRTLADGGCHAVTLFGIAGEYYKLVDDEKKKMMKAVVGECGKSKNAIPVIISVTEHSTEAAVRQAKYFESEGADCLMLLPPFFLKPSGEDLFRHMKMVGQAVKIPVMVQYAPEQTGVSIAPGVLARLNSEVGNMIYYKIECKPAGGYISSLLDITGGKIGVFVGNAGYQFIEAFDRGAAGAMPGCSMYDVYLRMYHAYMKGDRAGATLIHTALLQILNHIRQNVEMIISFEKKILKRRGIIENDYCRAPSFASDKYFDRLFDEYYENIAAYFA